MANRGGEMETVTDFILVGGSKITTVGGYSHEIKRHLLLGRKAMANLDSILKSRDVTWPTKVQIVKAVVFPVVLYGCKSQTWLAIVHAVTKSGRWLRDWMTKGLPLGSLTLSSGVMSNLYHINVHSIYPISNNHPKIFKILYIWGKYILLPFLKKTYLLEIIARFSFQIFFCWYS